MIKQTKLLNDTDWSNLHGNEVYVTMLRNKIKCDVTLSKAESTTGTTITKEADTLEGLDIVDYLEEVPEGLVYYKSENVYGWLKYEIYFESALDMENFVHFYNTTLGLHVIQK